MHRTSARLLLGAYLIAASAITLGPLPEHLLDVLVDAVRGLGDLPYSPTAHVVERAANVLLFVPIGTLLCASLPRAPALGVWLGCVVASAAVEAAQNALPDRTASVIDVVANGVGAGVGCLAHRALTRRPPQRS